MRSERAAEAPRQCSGKQTVVMRISSPHPPHTPLTQTALRVVVALSDTTHPSAAARDACRYMAGLVIGAVHGASKVEGCGFPLSNPQ